jgi:hypothetical protein
MREVVVELVGKKMRHRTGIKRQDGHHVRTVEFKAALVEDLWLWLVVDDVYNLTKSLAHVKR